MTYDDVVDYIKAAGCRIYVYNNKESIYGGNKGTFFYNEHGPIICVANKGTKGHKKIEILLHEYGHFLQWQDGWLQYLDNICDAYSLESDWLDNKVELSPTEARIARNTILTIEYDAEKRALDAATFLRPVHHDKNLYIQGANAYMAAIKWSWATRKKTSTTPRRLHFKPEIMDNDELFRDLTKKEINLITRSLNARS